MLKLQGIAGILYWWLVSTLDLRAFVPDVGEEPAQTPPVAPPTPSIPRLDARRAATTRRFGALGRGGRVATSLPGPLPGLPRFRESGAGAVPPRSLDLRMRRTTKEVGGGGGRKPRRLRWFLPPQRRLKSIAFAVLKIWICFACCWFVLLAEISDAGMWGENPSDVRACRVAQAAPPHTPYSVAECASRRNNAALWRIGEGGAGARR